MKISQRRLQMHQDATKTGREQAGGECLFFYFFFLAYDVFWQKGNKKRGK